MSLARSSSFILRGGGHKFYEEFGPIARSGPPDPKVMGPLFEKYDMTLLGPPLSPD